MKDLKILRRFAADIESGASFPLNYFKRFHDAAPGAVVELIDLVHDLSRRLEEEAASKAEEHEKLVKLLHAARRCSNKYTLPLYFHEALAACEEIG